MTERKSGPARKPQGVTFKTPSAAALSRTSPGTNNQLWRNRLGPIVEHPGRWALASTERDTDKASARVSYLRRVARDGRLPGDGPRWLFTYDECEVFACYREA